MKYFSRLKLYKASNVTFNPETLEAHSYRWWRFVQKINGHIVFNNYNYSPSTSKHQSKVRNKLESLGIKIDLFVYTRDSLCSSSGLTALKQALEVQDLERAALIQKVFKVKMTQDEIQELYNQKEERLCDAYLNRAFDYAEKTDAEQLEKFKTDFVKAISSVETTNQAVQNGTN